MAVTTLALGKQHQRPNKIRFIKYQKRKEEAQPLPSWLQDQSESASRCPGVINASFQVISIILLIAGEILSNYNKTQIRSLPHNNGFNEGL